MLERLHEELIGDGTAVLLARALYALGGVGKTQVALEYAYRFKEYYDLIWWIPAEQSQGISLALAELAARLGLKTSDNAAEAAATALEQLRRDNAGRWLLIFDNAADPADLEPFLPTGAGHVLITSRNHAWTHHAEPLELDTFTRQESVAHLMRYVPGLPLDSAAKISGAVGDLPLAIEQAAAWLAETGMPAALYIEQLETQTAKVLDEQAIWVRDTGGGDLEPIPRPAPGTITGRRSPASVAGVLLPRPNLYDPALWRCDERIPAAF